MTRFISVLIFLAAGAVFAQAPEGLRWEERLADGRMVQGRIDAGTEVYTLEGSDLSADQATALAIQAKPWSGPALDVPAATTTDSAEKSAPPEPQPAASYARQAAAPTIDATPPSAALHSDKQLSDADASKGTYRTGLFADLVVPFTIAAGVPSVGAWETLPDGRRIILVSIGSDAAAGIRVEFARLNLPTGGYAIVHDLDSAQVFGPYNTIPPGDETLWSPTLSGSGVQIEIVPPSVVREAETTVEIRRIVHQYVDPNLLSKAAGFCNLNVSCYPAWAQTALGVNGLGMISSSGSMFCTGSLLNDNNACTDTPYVLTAHHCVDTQTKASTLEFYWQYQTSACNTAPPSASSVPRTTGGADFLATAGGTGYTGGGNDFTLLRMRQAPPANLTKLGFLSTSPALGSQVTCVHHPRGDYKRITFGTLTATDNDHATLYHEVTWDQGTTEPGSSGSPLMLTSTQQIIGQLWGGGASCFALTDPDYYGRFNVTYPLIASILSAGNAVGFEEAELSALENVGSVMILLKLTQPAPPGGTTVAYALTQQSAQAGSDYGNAGGTVQFLQGETEAIFSIALINNAQTESEETFLITLSNPGSCLSLAPNATRVFRIIDDDPDTDGDGISDADELSGALGHVTSPTLVDSDADGINDRLEQLSLHTNPNAFDTDGDGYSDGLEQFLGSNPNVANTIALPTVRVPYFVE